MGAGKPPEGTSQRTESARMRSTSKKGGVSAPQTSASLLCGGRVARKKSNHEVASPQRWMKKKGEKGVRSEVFLDPGNNKFRFTGWGTKTVIENRWPQGLQEKKKGAM